MVIDADPKKEYNGIAGWQEINERGYAVMKKQAKAEGG